MIKSKETVLNTEHYINISTIMCCKRSLAWSYFLQLSIVKDKKAKKKKKFT